MFTFSTEDLRPQDRFDHWCEVRGKSLFGVTIELERERRADFHGRFSAVAIGNAVMAELSASSYRVSRTNADIARISSDSLCIGLQVRGPGHLDTGRDRIHGIREGDFIINHSDLPFVATPQRSDGFHYRTLKIPLTGELALGGRAYDLAPEALARGAGLSRLMAAMFNALSGPLDDVADPAADIEHIARLCLIARGRLSSGLPESRAAIRTGVLHAARAILVRDLQRPDLAPAAVAAELAISLRQLHLVFEPTGRSFARTLAAIRVKQARRLLETMPTRPVADIAYACGFDSIATFYRAFRSAYGTTPSDMRAASFEA
jgi:AraC-like DNA-binding protein